MHRLTLGAGLAMALTAATLVAPTPGEAASHGTPAKVGRDAGAAKAASASKAKAARRAKTAKASKATGAVGAAGAVGVGGATGATQAASDAAAAGVTGAAEAAEAAEGTGAVRAAPAAATATATTTKIRRYADHAEARAFAADVATRRGLSLVWVESQLAQAQRIEAARRLVMPAPVASAKNWAAYRARFIEPQRVAAGVAFWRANAAWLQRAEDRFGVPADIVVGIVGVETFYGRVVGNFRSLDVLATLAFDFPPGRSDRSAFFRGELEELLVLCARQGSDPPSLKGSFAGAMGLPQFMPGSINRWAVDFDGDGRVDLHGSNADVVGSVANYLQAHGWQRGMPTHYAVQPPTDAASRAALLVPDILPTFSAAQMAAAGALLQADGAQHAGPLALVELHNGGADVPASYVAGTQNFYAVTRYNWSSYYALAVIELGQAVKAAR